MSLIAIKNIQSKLKKNKKDYKLFYQAALLFLENKDFKNAKIYFNKAINLKPKDYKVYYDYANLLFQLNELEEALKLVNNSINLNKNENSYLLLAMINKSLGNNQEALNIFENLLKRDPNSIEINMYLGVHYSNLKIYDKAEYYLKKWLSFGLFDEEVYFTLATTFLRQKKFELGWKFYSYRSWKFNLLKKDKKATTFLENISKVQNYNGESLENKTLYVIQEQGFGDNLMFAYFLKKLPKTCKIKFFVIKDLVELMETSFFDCKNIEILELFKNIEIKCDYRIRLLDLLRFYVKEESDAFIKPYLKFKQTKKSFITSDNKFKIGFSFKGSTQHTRDLERSFKIEDFINILIFNEKVTYYCLEKVLSKEQELFLKDKKIELIGDKLKSFNDTAIAVNELDLIISVDTAVAHMGALSKVETWILIPFLQDWRWDDQGDRSYWYAEHVKLIRENKLDTFEDRINQTKSELRNKLQID